MNLIENGNNGLSGFVRVKELSTILGVSRSTIFRMERDGILPPKVQISQRAVGFRVSDIEAFIEKKHHLAEAKVVTYF